MLTKDLIYRHLILFKKKSKEKIKKMNYKGAIKYLELFALLSYNYNLFYTDDEVEGQLSIISKDLLGINKIHPQCKRIIFYDSFAIDNRGLTQQYLRAIFSWGCELLYITNAKVIGPDILRELNDYSKAKILTYDKSKFNKWKNIVNEIVNFNPEKVFLHFSPWDIAGICIWNSITNVDRFFINLTDHAFWLGKNTFDYILEFRTYGSFLSIKERGIPVEKLLLQPYYPIINNNPFQGFPFDNTEQKTIVFAGSNLYKIAGKNNTFLKLMKEVLNNNETTIFVLAGPGNNSTIKKFIKDNHIEDRFYLLGDRKDISALVSNIDIYVNTFPMIGGLMSQYAAYFHKPIIGYTSPDLYWCNNTEDLLQVPNEKLLVKDSKGEFVQYFSQLISSENVRKNNIQLTLKSILTPEDFSTKLLQNIYKNKYIVSLDDIKDVSFDPDAISELYIEMENSYLKSHYSNIFIMIKFSMLYYFPFQFFRNLYLNKNRIYRYLIKRLNDVLR